jgi:hypothetical protein
MLPFYEYISSSADLGSGCERKRIRRTTMKSDTMLKGAFVAFCLIGMLVLPAAAVSGNGQIAKMNGSAVDQGLKDELWANHQQYRLKGFDTNVERSNSVIGIVGKYGVDTTESQATLSTIGSKRTELEAALDNHDKESLKSVNGELKTLWQQFRTEMKDALRDRYGKGAASLIPSVPGTETT